MSEEKEKKAKGPKIDLASMSVTEAVEALNQLYGANTIIRADQAKGMKIRFTSTGCDWLDLATGGGFAENRIIEIRGPYSSFKSTISLVSLRQFQKKYRDEDGHGIYIDLERTFDPFYAEALGVDLKRLFLVNPDSGEQAVNVVGHLFALRIPLWMILDSIAALVPTAEIIGEAEQQSMGLQARLVNKLMRLATSRLKVNLYDAKSPSCTVLAMNQLRQKITMFGDPETTPGGVGKDFFFSQIIRLSSKKSNLITKEETINKVKHEVKYGQEVEFRIIKNKCGGPQHEEGKFTYWYKDYEDNKAFTFNNVDALFHYGAFNNVIELNNQGKFEYGDVIAAKEGEFKRRLRKRPELMRQLYKDVLAVVRPKKLESMAIDEKERKPKIRLLTA